MVKKDGLVPEPTPVEKLVYNTTYSQVLQNAHTQADDGIRNKGRQVRAMGGETNSVSIGYVAGSVAESCC